ncbi:MAG: NADAR family protein [Patescibacteria group bacterium]
MIDSFNGRNFFLSNMSVVDNPLVTPDGARVLTAEHYYMSMRFIDEKTRFNVANARADDRDDRIFAHGLAAKKMAHQYILEGQPHHKERYERIAIMHSAVFCKFVTNPDFARLLLETQNQKLVEGNDWGDVFWGVSPVGSSNGENYLGKILMYVRQNIRERTQGR